MEVELIDKFVVIYFVGENMPDDAAKKRSAVVKEKLPSQLLVVIQERLYDCLVGHLFGWVGFVADGYMHPFFLPYG